MKEGLAQANAMLDQIMKSALQRDEYVKKELNKTHERLQRHRRDLYSDHREIGKLHDITDSLGDQGIELASSLESMERRLCRCRDGRENVPMRGEGSESHPYEFGSDLEYEGSPPSPHHETSGDVERFLENVLENVTPLPIPSPVALPIPPSNPGDGSCCVPTSLPTGGEISREPRYG